MIPNLADLIPLLTQLRKSKMPGDVDTSDDMSTPQFQPNHQAFDQMSNTISNLPTRDPNPSLMRRIGGGIVGMGAGLHPLAVEGGQPIGATYDPMKADIASDQFVQKRYHDAMDDISDKVKIQEPLVNAENSQNQNKLSLFNADQNRKVQARTQERLEARDKEIADQNDVKNELARKDEARKQQWTDATVFKAQHPAMKGYIDKDGMLVFVDPTKPDIVVHTGVDTGKMNDMEKIQAGIEGKLSEIKAQGQQARETKVTVPGKNTSGTSSGKSGMSATQKMADIQNKTKEAYETHPEWKGYIRINPDTKKYEISAPKNADNNVINSLAKFVYGEEMVRMISPDGKPGWVKKSQEEYAKSKGFKSGDK